MSHPGVARRSKDKYAEAAKSAGVPAIISGGIYPGVSNVMAAHIISIARKEYDEEWQYRQPQPGECVHWCLTWGFLLMYWATNSLPLKQQEESSVLWNKALQQYVCRRVMIRWEYNFTSIASLGCQISSPTPHFSLHLFRFCLSSCASSSRLPFLLFHLRSSQPFPCESSFCSPGEGREPNLLRYSYYTAGSGGAGPTILQTSFLLAGETVTVYKDGEKFELPPISNRREVDFGPGGLRGLEEGALMEVCFACWFSASA